MWSAARMAAKPQIRQAVAIVFRKAVGCESYSCAALCVRSPPSIGPQRPCRILVPSLRAFGQRLGEKCTNLQVNDRLVTALSAPTHSGRLALGESSNWAALYRALDRHERRLKRQERGPLSTLS